MTFRIYNSEFSCALKVETPTSAKKAEVRIPVTDVDRLMELTDAQLRVWLYDKRREGADGKAYGKSDDHRHMVWVHQSDQLPEHQERKIMADQKRLVDAQW